jgi:glycosyltransferase involved in cell wall biosynthesis
MVSKTIESALAQSYSNIEVLVVDNASEDNIEAVVAGYNDPRLKLFKNSKNLGQFGNFNRCIDLSKGEYIHILHSDDFIDSNFTKTCIEFMESHPNVMMTFSTVHVFTNNTTFDGCVSDCIKMGIYDHDVIYPAPDGFRNILEKGGVMCPTVIVKRTVYDTVGQFSLEYPFAGDLYQWLKIARRFDIAFIADAILFYRQGEHSESFQLIYQSPLGWIDTIKIFIRIIDELGIEVTIYRRELNIVLRRLMLLCIDTSIYRSSMMKVYSPLVMLGFSINHWSLIQPESLFDQIKKCAEFFFILIVGCIIILPGGRFCIHLVRSSISKMLSISRSIR